jgi:hypothetical protein
MKTALLLLIFVFSICTAFGQVDSSSHRHTSLGSYLIALEQLTGKDSIVHEDSVYSYKITIPAWWHILEASSPNAFGGTFPAVDGIENAMVIKAFLKTDYDNVRAFENWLFDNFNPLNKSSLNNNPKLLLKKQLNDFKNIGKAYKVQLLNGRLIYHCRYVIVETKTAYLWIDFTATQTTYDKNFPKFTELMSLFSKIE